MTIQNGLAAAAFCTGLMVTAADAATIDVSVDGTDYTLETITGTYDALSLRLVSQSWWGDASLAGAFAEAVQGNMDDANATFGLFFAYSEFSGTISDGFLAATIETGSSEFMTEAGFDYVSYIFAVTAAVPVPAALPLLLAGLAGFVWIGRRRAAA